MADGDNILPNKVSCTYVSDTGKEYRRMIPAFYQTQASLGWVLEDTPGNDPVPNGLKPRVVLTYDAGAKANRRRVVVATNAAYMALEDGDTLTVDWGGVADTFTVYGKEGERRRGKGLDTA